MSHHGESLVLQPATNVFLHRSIMLFDGCLLGTECVDGIVSKVIILLNAPAPVEPTRGLHSPSNYISLLCR